MIAKTNSPEVATGFQAGSKQTQSQHTPGPWIVKQRKFSRGHTIRDAKGDLLAIITESDANARLIAAAPELLEALEAMRRLSRLNALSNDYARAWQDTVRMTDAALAKAKGGAL